MIRYVAVADAAGQVIGVRESERRNYTHAVVANVYQGIAIVQLDAVMSYHTSEAHAANGAAALKVPGRWIRTYGEIRIVPVVETARRAKVGERLAAALLERAPRDTFNNRHED